jgi:Muramidase (flagellum-specific)
MIILKNKICLLLFFLAVITTSYAQNLSRSEYIEKYKDIAIRQMNKYKIPASIILAQACLESANGNSTLAVKAKNHFGIKCGGNWDGKRYKHNDDKRRECFRKYSNIEDSFMDHSIFLTSGSRYNSLFDLKITDYKGWAHGLKAAGYATNPKYAKLLIDIIEEYELYKYDSPKSNTLSKKELRKQKREARKKAKEEKRRLKNLNNNNLPDKSITQIVQSLPVELPKDTNYTFNLDNFSQKNNGVSYIIAKEGDTFESIAKENNLFEKELLNFNDLGTSTKIVKGSVIYLEKKKKKGEINSYIVKEGDSMYDISQKFAIRLKNLYLINNMKVGEEPLANSTIKLR